MTMEGLLISVLEAREKAEEMKKLLAAANEVKSETEQKLMELMELSNTKSFKTEGGVGVVRKEQLYTNVNKDNRDELLVWVDEECGRPDLIKRNVHPKSLTSFISQRLKDGEAVPQFITCFFKPILSITRR